MYLDDTTNEFKANEAKSDEELLSRSINEPELFQIIIDRYQNAFIRKLRGVFPGREELISDTVQDAFVKMYLNAAKYKIQPGASFKSWAYKVLLNTAFTAYQKLKRDNGAVQVMDEEFLEQIESGDLGEREKKLDTDQLMSMISRLPVIFSRVLELYVVEQRSQKEIADIVGITPGAVRARIHRAKKELKKIARSDNPL